MTKPMFERVALIGIGLIGSSISHATRRQGLAKEIVGSARTRATLDTALKLGLIDKGHESATEAVKGADLWSARAGITGGSAMILPVLLTEGVRPGRLSLSRLVALTSYNAARLFRLYPRKGALDVGSDADLVIVDPDRQVKVDLAALHSVVDFSPYEGYLAQGWAATTIAGGEVVYDGGEVVAERLRGRYLPRAA